VAPIRMCVVAFLLGVLAIASPLAGQERDDRPVAFNQGGATEPKVEVLDRGLVHEAFAHPSQEPVAPPSAIDRPPPDPVPELPAEQKPEGDNVQWLPGYWAWDGERKEFTWISGLYRDVPAGRQYVPGYWARTDEGWQWVPGYFAPERQAEAPQYVTEPPASLDVGPSVPPPDDSSFYTPGWWAFNDGEYFWRPGCWTPYRPGLVWVCPRYLWSPGGWIFCSGYWDYPFARRGLLFAPLALRGGWGPGWVHRPRFAVGGLLNGLFWRAGSPFYRFGPYSGAGFARAGYRPWFNGANRFDPLVSYYRNQNRGNAGWLDGLQRSYQGFARGQGGPQVALVNQLRQNTAPVTILSQEQLVRQRINAQAYRQAAVQRGKVETGRAAPRVNPPAKTGGITPKAVPAPARTVSPPASRAPVSSPRPAATPKPTSPPANVRPGPARAAGASPKASAAPQGRSVYSSPSPPVSRDGTRSFSRSSGQSSTYRQAPPSNRSSPASQPRGGGRRR